MQDDNETVITPEGVDNEVPPMAAKKEKKVRAKKEGASVPYWQTEKGKAAAAAYRNSEKGKAARAKYAAKAAKAKKAKA